MLKPVVLIAVVLIGLGILAIVSPTLTFTNRESVVDVGPIQVTTETDNTVRIPVVLGAAAIAGGVVLLVMKRPRHT